MIMRGYRQEDIAGQLGITHRQVVRDLKDARRDMQAESGVQVQYEQLFAQLNEESKLRVRKIWARITDARCTEKGFFRGLRELRAEDEF